MTGKKRFVLIGFGIFLGFMAICTMVAKGLYTSGLAKVNMINPQQKNITHSVDASGIVKQGQEYGVYVPSGLRVATISVHVGDIVSIGSPLLQIEIEDLKKVIAEKELSLAKLQAQQKEAATVSQKETEKNQLTLTKTQEEYDKTIRNADLMLQRNRELLAEAEKELKEYRDYVAADAGQVSEGDSESQESRTEKLKLLEKAVTEASAAVEDAILARQDAEVFGSQSLEEARLAGESAYSATEAANRLDAQYQKEIIQELKQLLQTDGWVYAAEAGRITNQKLTVGDRTQDSASVLYALDEGERLLEVPLTKEQSEYIQMGDSVELSYQDRTGKKRTDHAIVSYLTNAADGSTIAQIPLGALEVTIGQSVSMSIAKQSDPYELTIPISALHSETTGGHYVYLVEQQEGILGMEWRIRKASVSVLEQNDQYAAIENSGITQETRLVLSANKEYKEGDVVRLLE